MKSGSSKIKAFFQKYRFRRVATVVAGAAALRLLVWFLIYRFASNDRTRTYEIYTSRVFPVITQPMKSVAKLFPFSVGETLVIIMAALFVAGLVICTVRAVRNKKYARIIAPAPKKPAGFARLLVMLLVAALLIGGNFFVYGGINYKSLTFKELSGLDVENTDTETLEKLCLYLGKKATEARQGLPLDEKGFVVDSRSAQEILSASPAGYAKAAEEFSCLSGRFTPPKAALFSEIMSYEQIAGIFPIVFTESIVNKNAPAYDLPSVACHELAHQLGFAQEDEANFIGYLAAICSDDPLYIYSGYYSGFCYAMNKLYSFDRDRWAAVWQSPEIDAEGISNDMRRSNEIWDSYRKKAEVVSKVSEAVNDSYLKSNDISDGTHSYGRVVDLLIAYYSEQLPEVSSVSGSTQG